MSVGGIMGGLLKGLAGNLMGGLFGAKPQQGGGTGVNVNQTVNQPGTVQTVGGTGKTKSTKAGKLALIKTSGAGVLDDDISSSGRGKLLGN